MSCRVAFGLQVSKRRRARSRPFRSPFRGSARTTARPSPTRPMRRAVSCDRSLARQAKFEIVDVPLVRIALQHVVDAALHFRPADGHVFAQALGRTASARRTSRCGVHALRFDLARFAHGSIRKFLDRRDWRATSSGDIRSQRNSSVSSRDSSRWPRR